jgi:hypothetical protein
VGPACANKARIEKREGRNNCSKGWKADSGRDRTLCVRRDVPIWIAGRHDRRDGSFTLNGWGTERAEELAKCVVEFVTAHPMKVVITRLASCYETGPSVLPRSKASELDRADDDSAARCA